MMEEGIKQIYETEFMEAYNQKNYDKAFRIFSENKEIEKYLSSTQKRFMTMELKRNMAPTLEILATYLIKKDVNKTIQN